MATISTELIRILIYLLLVLTAACTVSALAADTSHSVDLQSQAGTTLPMETVRAGRFELMDLNHDGYLQPDEVDPNDITLISQFRALDENGDGQLSEAEYVLFGKVNR